VEAGAAQAEKEASAKQAASLLVDARKGLGVDVVFTRNVVFYQQLELRKDWLIGSPFLRSARLN